MIYSAKLSLDKCMSEHDKAQGNWSLASKPDSPKSWDQKSEGWQIHIQMFWATTSNENGLTCTNYKKKNSQTVKDTKNFVLLEILSFEKNASWHAICLSISFKIRKSILNEVYTIIPS